MAIKFSCGDTADAFPFLLAVLKVNSHFPDTFSEMYNICVHPYYFIFNDVHEFVSYKREGYSPTVYIISLSD